MQINHVFFTVCVALLLGAPQVLTAATGHDVNLVNEFFDQSFRLTGHTLKTNLKKKSLEELLEAQKAVHAVENDRGAQEYLAGFYQTQAPNVQAHLRTIEGWIATIIEEKKPKPVSVQPVAPKPTPTPIIEKKPEPVAPTPIAKKPEIEARIIEPKANVSEIKIPMDKLHNLMIFIEPSVKRGRLFEFHYSSLAQLKEMQQTADAVYQDDNAMRYIAEKLGSNLSTVKITVSSLIGQLPKQIAQQEEAKKKEEERERRGPRRWGS